MGRQSLLPASDQFFFYHVLYDLGKAVSILGLSHVV